MLWGRRRPLQATAIVDLTKYIILATFYNAHEFTLDHAPFRWFGSDRNSNQSIFHHLSSIVHTLWPSMLLWSNLYFRRHLESMGVLHVLIDIPGWTRIISDRGRRSVFHQLTHPNEDWTKLIRTLLRSRNDFTTSQRTTHHTNSNLIPSLTTT